MRDGHVRDAAQDVAEDVTQDVMEDVLGAVENGTPSVSSTPNCPPPPRPPRLLHRRFLYRRAKRSLNV